MRGLLDSGFVNSVYVDGGFWAYSPEDSLASLPRVVANPLLEALSKAIERGTLCHPNGLTPVLNVSWTSPDASWRRMYVSQPVPSEIVMMSYMFLPETTRGASPSRKGVRLGDDRIIAIEQGRRLKIPGSERFDVLESNEQIERMM